MKVMKPIARTTIPSGDGWLYEVKYDGFRCILDWGSNHIKLTSKNNMDLTNQFPEIVAFCLELQDQVNPYLPIRLDGELVILNTAYQANFPEIQWRGRLKNKDKITQAAQQRPATLMAFDVIQMNGNKLDHKTLEKRKTHLKEMMDVLGAGIENRLQLVETFDVSDELWSLIFDNKSEGLIAKRKNSTYQSGKRHDDWYKIKNWRQIDGILHTYNTSNGYFSVSVFQKDALHAIGKCKHGFDDKALHTLKQIFLTEGDKQGNEYTLPPAIVATMHTLDLYDNTLREPEFHSLSVHTPATACTLNKLKQDLTMFPTDGYISIMFSMEKIKRSSPPTPQEKPLTQPLRHRSIGKKLQTTCDPSHSHWLMSLRACTNEVAPL